MMPYGTSDTELGTIFLVGFKIFILECKLELDEKVHITTKT